MSRDDWQERAEKAEAEIKRLTALLAAKDQLLVCYRTGKRPSGKLMDTLAALAGKEKTK